jgi:hypothetical protein
MEGDTARTRRNDPITSHEAADSTSRPLADSQLFAWVMLATFGPLADHELIVKSSGKWSDSRLRTARHELTEAGTVIDTGIYRLTPSGRRAKVWQVSA